MEAIPTIKKKNNLQKLPALHFKNFGRNETKVKVKSLSHVQLCDPTDYSPPGYFVHGILQARILE